MTDTAAHATSVDRPTSDVVTHHTFCRVCHASCPMEVDVDAAHRVVAVRGVDDDPLFEGYTCIKGRQLPDQMAHPDRLRAPLRRRPDGTFEQTTSARALDEIADRLRRIIDDHGPRAVASYTGTGGYQNSVAVPTAQAFHHGIGSISFYTSVTIDQPAKTTAPIRAGTWEAGFHGFSDADVLLAVGYNPMVSSYSPIGGLQGTNPFVVLRRAKARGMRLIVIDPRRTELASQADVHLAVRPGEDPTLLAGIIGVILREGLHDIEFCKRWVEGLDELAEAAAAFDLADVAERCGVDAEDIVRAARIFAAGPRGTAGTGTGPSMAPHSSLTEHLVLCLNVLCGRVNREGDRLESGWFLYPEVPKRAQAIAPRDPTPGPPARVRGLRGYRGQMPTATLAEEILTPGEGQVRALIVSGGNPVVAFPDQELTLRAMLDLDLLVVVDHRMTATAEHADYVLAPTLSLERADVPHLMDRWFREPYTNYTPAVVPKDGDVLNEWEVFWELASRLGTDLPYPGGSPDMTVKPDDDEIIDRAYAGSRMPLDEVRTHVREVHPDRAIVVQPADPACTTRISVCPDGVADELGAVRRQRSAADAVTDDAESFPFRLVSRRLKHVLNSLGPELPGLARKGTTNPAYMNPTDMATLSLDDGDLVEITSPSGTITGVAEAAADVRPGVISMAHSWGGSSLTDEKVRDIGTPTNRLVSTAAGHDPINGMIVSSAIPVAVSRVGDSS